MRPVQKAQSLARKHGRPMYVFFNPDKQAKAGIVISDTDPGPSVWPCTIVHPDGRPESRKHP